MPPVRVVMSPGWRIVALEVGSRRNKFADDAGYRHRYENERTRENGAYYHILGVMSEIAVAQYLGLPWDEAVGRLNATDVGNRIEVRCREPRSGVDLFLSPKDRERDHLPFVLVHMVDYDGFAVDLVGWTIGKDAMTPERRRAFARYPEGVWFVRPDELRPMSELAERTRS